MNTNPDEATLALWLDDELTGEQLAAVESWAITQPDQMAAREEVRKWRTMMASAIPAAEEPPYPDFFNSRVLQAIRDSAPKTEPVRKRPFSWNSWLMPLAACAGMVFAFWIGKKSSTAVNYDVAGAPKAIPVEPVVYTPEKGVDAEWFASARASATVIVLNGVAAIPDSTDFSETVYVPMDREIDSTAGGVVNPGTDTGR
ncbi:MAG: hypothetical protein ABIS50_18050 [Luteolibacter sp.]|uniref:anti-sigma factor n=1 Tax=Luteolibacter sp. TaxID=1962973 RepID=UPI0032673B0C